MRKTLVIAVAAAVALATAAIAMAAVFTASGVSATTATFATDKVKLRSASCTGADGKAFTITHGRYTGTATFADPAAELSGALTIEARTTYSTTDGLGYVTGSFRVRDGQDDRNRLGGRFTATLKGSQLVGFLNASSRGHHARVLGNLSATFVPAAGFTAGAVARRAPPPCWQWSEARSARSRSPHRGRRFAASTARSRRSVTAASAARSRSRGGAC